MQTIKTALCAFGMSGRVFHAPFIQLHKGFELVGVLERSTNLAQQFYPNIKSYDSYEELLNDDIDLVIINTPTHSHYELTKEALMNDKHVVVEKAFTTTVGEASGLKFLAEQVERKLAVYQNRRWDSDFLTIKKIVEDGVLGDIVEAEFHFDRFNLNLSPKKHKEEPNPGAGIVLDLGPHLIDQAINLFGMPNKLFADIRHTRPTTQVEDYFDILLFYDNLRVRLKAGYIVQEPLPAYILHGTKGSFLKQRGDVQEALLQQNKKPNLKNWGEEEKETHGNISYLKNEKIFKEKVKSLKGNYYHFYDELYESIINNKKEPVTAQDGLNVMIVIEAIFKSAKEEKIVEILN